jgi:hypothetical protein
VPGLPRGGGYAMRVVHFDDQASRLVAGTLRCGLYVWVGTYFNDTDDRVPIIDREQLTADPAKITCMGCLVAQAKGEDGGER